MSVNKGSLAVISTFDNNIEVFGISNDKTALQHISFNGSAWSTQPLLSLKNGLYTSAPSVVSTRPRSFDVFAIDTDDNLKTRHFDGASWRPDNGWQHMHDSISGAVNPVALGPLWHQTTDRYDVYTRDTNGYALTIYNIAEDPKRFVTAYWRQYAKSSPIRIITGSDSFEEFHVGFDDYFYHTHWFPAGEYHGPYPRESQIIGYQKFISPPTVVTNAPGRVDIFGIAPNQTVLHNSYQDSRDIWTGWELGNPGIRFGIRCQGHYGTRLNRRCSEIFLHRYSDYQREHLLRYLAYYLT